MLAGGRATRLPDKPLVDLSGEPLVLHPVRAMQAAGLTPTVVGKLGDGRLRATVEAAGCAWLTEPGSLTARCQRACASFRVRLLRYGKGQPLADEACRS